MKGRLGYMQYAFRLMKFQLLCKDVEEWTNLRLDEATALCRVQRWRKGGCQ